MTVESLKITALTVEQAASILSAAGRRQVTVELSEVNCATILRNDRSIAVAEVWNTPLCMSHNENPQRNSLVATVPQDK